MDKIKSCNKQFIFISHSIDWNKIKNNQMSPPSLMQSSSIARHTTGPLGHRWLSRWSILFKSGSHQSIVVVFFQGTKKKVAAKRNWRCCTFRFLFFSSIQQFRNFRCHSSEIFLLWTSWLTAVVCVIFLFRNTMQSSIYTFRKWYVSFCWRGRYQSFFILASVKWKPCWVWATRATSSSSSSSSKDATL